MKKQLRQDYCNQTGATVFSQACSDGIEQEQLFALTGYTAYRECSLTFVNTAITSLPDLTGSVRSE